MQSKIVAVLVALAILLLATPAVLGRPPHRQKRVSDQRLGELEALLALKKLRGKLVTVPVGFGQIDPNEFGRRRRSASHNAVASRLLLERIIDSLPVPVQVQVADDGPIPAAGSGPGDAAYEDSSLPAASENEIPSPRWAAATWERPAPVFNRPAAD